MKRAAASKTLAVVGEPALPGLRDAAASLDAEVRWRAAELISLIERRAADRNRTPFLALVAKFGGRITPLDSDADNRMAVSVDLSNTLLTDNDLKGLGDWSELRELDLSGTNITDDTLARLRSATALRYLKLDEVVVTNSGLYLLQSVAQFYGCVRGSKARITDKGVAELRKSLPNLKVMTGRKATTSDDYDPGLIGD